MPLTDEEKENLEASLLEDGCRDPLVIWKEEGILLDGHHRYDLCEKHGIDYDVVEKSLPSRTAAKDWVILNQLGRRNLTPQQASYLRGKLYQSWKSEPHRPKASSTEDKGQNEEKSSSFSGSNKTAKSIAETSGVSERTVREDEKYAKSVDEIGDSLGIEKKEEILAGKIKIPKKQIQYISHRAQSKDNQQERKDYLKKTLNGNTGSNTGPFEKTEPMKGVSAQISAETHRKLKTIAMDRAIGLNQLVAEILEKYASSNH